MFWLNEERPYAKKVGAALSCILVLSYAFANFPSNDKSVRIMANYGFGGSISFVAVTLFTSIASFFIFAFALRIAYTSCMRSVLKLQDRRMPISSRSLFHHAYFVMIIANVVIGAVGVMVYDYEMYSNIVNALARVVIKAAAYAALIALSKNGRSFDVNFTSKMVACYGMIFAVMAVLGV